MDRIRLCFEEQATGELQRIYKDIRHETHFPWVPMVFQALAPFCDFTRLCWRELRPLVRHQAVEYGAAHLLRLANERVAAELKPENDVDYLLDRKLQRSLTKYHRQLLPFYLAAPRIAIWLSRVHTWFFERRPAESPELLRLQRLPYPTEMGEVVRPIRDETATPSCLALFEQIQGDLRLPFVSTIYRVMARNPEFLSPAWHSLREMFPRPEFKCIGDDLEQAAYAWSHELPLTKITREQIEKLPDMDEHSMRLLSVVVDVFQETSLRLIIHLTYWSHQLHAARSRE